VLAAGVVEAAEGDLVPDVVSSPVGAIDDVVDLEVTAGGAAGGGAAVAVALVDLVSGAARGGARVVPGLDEVEQEGEEAVPRGRFRAARGAAGGDHGGEVAGEVERQRKAERVVGGAPVERLECEGAHALAGEAWLAAEGGVPFGVGRRRGDGGKWDDDATGGPQPSLG